MSELYDDLPTNLPTSFLDAVVAGARRAHEIAARNFNELEGSDGVTFGVDRYRFSWFWIARKLDSVPGVATRHPTTSFHAVVDDKIIRFYNGGRDRQWDPNTFDFTDTPRRARAGKNNADQLAFDLDLGGESVDVAGATDLIVTYSGNPLRGCEAVHVGAPVWDAGTDIQSWAWMKPLWVLEPGSGGGAAATSTPDLPTQPPGYSDLPAAEYDVGLKPDAAEGDEEPGSAETN